MGTNNLAELEPYLSQLTLPQLNELYAALADYVSIPVGIEEFLDSEEFLGPFWQGNLYPYWREVLKQIYPNPFFSPYFLVSFRGAIGLGKTSVACAGIAYDLYRLLMMAEPQKSFGLISSTKIVFAIFNRTMTLASDVVWDKLSQMFVQSPFFSQFLGALHTKRSKEETMFPKRIDFTMGSRMGHALGQAIYDAIIDEANFEVVENQTKENFNSVLRRMESRFMQPGGTVGGKIWIVSSETEKFSAMNQVVDSYRGKPGVLVTQAPLWDVKTKVRGMPLYSGQRFWVYAGSDVRQPEIIPETSQLITQEAENCLEVPVEHRDSFEADIHAALRDLGGRSTVSSYKLFRLRDRLSRALAVAPLFPEVFRLDFDDESDQIQNYLEVPKYFSNPLNKTFPRYIHIDIGLTGDRLGIAATYVNQFTERKSRDLTTFEETVENLPSFVTEWALGIEPTPGKEIPLYKIRLFLQWISQQGYLIGGVTLDGFQCFTGDTRISLLDGTEVPIRELEGQEEFWVYSCDKDGNVVPGRGHSARKTGVQAPLLKVTLDNGEEIRCTTRHKFLLRTGEYREAQDLQPGDSLMPLYKKPGMGGYEIHLNPRTKKWRYTHVMVGQWKYPHYLPSRHDNPEGHKIHHCLGKKNNDPRFLEFCENTSDHMRRFHSQPHPHAAEAVKAWWSAPENRERRSSLVSSQLKELWKDPSYREKILTHPSYKEGATRGAQNEERRQKARDNCKRRMEAGAKPNLKPEITSELVIERYQELKSIHKVAKELGIHPETVADRLGSTPRYGDGVQRAAKLNCRRWHKTPREGCEFCSPNNHKVVSVVSAGFEDVYDIEVDEYHNFALSAGVFVHNSADMRQQLIKMGFDCEIISVDRTSAPYFSFRTAVYDGRAMLPQNNVLKRELEELEVDVKADKVDHPQKNKDNTKGSKDIADAACFTGDTRISLLDGTEVPIQDLVGREEFWVYSCLPNGKVVPGRGHSARVTKHVTELIEVTLDNGEKVRCTPDHRWMMRDGSYKEAQDLKEGDSLMPLYRKISDGVGVRTLVGYELIHNNQGMDWNYTHKIMAPSFLVERFQDDRGRWKYKAVIHHKDFNKRNNCPSNLVWMTWQDHKALHCSHQSEFMKNLWSSGKIKPRDYSSYRQTLVENGKKSVKRLNSPDSIKIRVEKLKANGSFSKSGTIVMNQLWKSEEFRSQHSLRARVRMEEKREESSQEMTTRNKSEEHQTKCMKGRIKKLAVLIVQQGLDLSDWSNSIDKLIERGVITKHRSIKNIQKYFGSIPELTRELSLNHRVVSKEKIELGSPIPVYDITVDEHHNFALSSGVFVHNCGSIFSASNNSHKFRLLQAVENRSISSEQSAKIKNLFWST